MRTYQLIICLLLGVSASAQSVKEGIQKAMNTLLTDQQTKHATVSLYVADANTGETIFEKNGSVYMAPASAQKIVTSAAALELLGKNYRFTTPVFINGTITNGTLNGDIIIEGKGDPTIASWRYKERKEDHFTTSLVAALKNAGIQKVNGKIIGIDKSYGTHTLPGGWVWDDMGNYYGAGVGALNWKENQFDLYLKPGAKQGDPVSISRTEPKLYDIDLRSELLTGAPGSGDNGIIYLPPFANKGFVRGTVPPGNSFMISGAVPDPSFHFVHVLHDKITAAGISISNKPAINNDISTSSARSLMEYRSPSLDSIVYWFLQKSVNLYGEALVKALAFEKNGKGDTDDGLELVKKFLQQQDIDPSLLRVIDGSGLSPQNRVTTEGLVRILQLAKKKSWYDAFYAGLPTYNGMKLKSGSIGGARSFAGYHTSKAGRSYMVAIIVNGYEGSSGAIVQKMFRVLDELK